MTTCYRLHYAPDNASLIIRLVLDELGQPYETLLVDRSTMAQRSPAYLSLNPAGKIPTLETPSGVISEVGAILTYLGETHGAMVPPTGHPARLTYLKWLFFTANTFHPDLIMQFYVDRYGPDAALLDMRKRTSERLVKHLTLLDQAMADATWFTCSTPSMLDYYIATCLRWAALYPMGGTDWFDLSRFPHLTDLAQRLDGRPATQAAITAEGLGPTPFSAPRYATPPEGVAL